MSAGLAIRGVEKSFGDEVILRGIDVSVPRGAFCVLLGASGCGKSTLLRIVAGLDAPTRGTVLIGDRDVTRLPPRDRDIAMVFQSYALYPHMTVRENLAFGLTLRRAPPVEIEARVAEAAELLGLGALLERLPKALSGGQRQRVAMGRAIVRRPALFLFDEPLSNLDAALRAEVRVEIRRLHDRLGATSVYVTHDQVEAMTLADQIVLLRGGHVEQIGPPLEVYRRPRTAYVGAFLGSPPMSFLAGEATEAGIALAGGIELRTPTRVAAGTKLRVGVRPEDVALGGGEVTIPGRVARVESLGGDTVAFVEAAPGSLVVRAHGRARVSVGEPIELGFARAAVSAFEADDRGLSVLG